MISLYDSNQITTYILNQSKKNQKSEMKKMLTILQGYAYAFSLLLQEVFFIYSQIKTKSVLIFSKHFLERT